MPPTETHLPGLETKRLVLEPLAWKHADGMFALWSSAEVCLHAGGAVDLDGQPVRLPALRHADSDRILAFFVEHARRGTAARWAVIRREDGRFLGAVGLNALRPAAELAYHLHPDHWGCGYATEACGAVVDWVRAALPGVTVEAFVEPANAASVALAERLGFEATAANRDGATRYALEAG